MTQGQVEDFFVGADALNNDFGADQFGGDDDTNRMLVSRCQPPMPLMISRSTSYGLSKRLTTANTTQTPMVMTVRSDIFVSFNIMCATDIEHFSEPCSKTTSAVGLVTMVVSTVKAGV